MMNADHSTTTITISATSIIIMIIIIINQISWIISLPQDDHSMMIHFHIYIYVYINTYIYITNHYIYISLNHPQWLWHISPHENSPQIPRCGAVQDHLTGHTGCLSRLLLVAWELKNLPRRSPSWIIAGDNRYTVWLVNIAMENKWK